MIFPFSLQSSHTRCRIFLFSHSLCFGWSNRRWHRPHTFDVLNSSTYTVSQNGTFCRHWNSYRASGFLIQLDGLNDVPIIICHLFVQNCIHRLLCTYICWSSSKRTYFLWGMSAGCSPCIAMSLTVQIGIFVIQLCCNFMIVRSTLHPLVTIILLCHCVKLFA